MLKREKKILVVDDEAVIRDIIKRKLISATDFSVVEAEDGYDALERLREGKIDLIITDIKMPRMSGIELLAEIRRLGLDTPVIIITGYGTLNDAIDALRLGALNFIKKPFHTNELLGVIDRVFTVFEEKVFLKDVLPFVNSQTAHLVLPNDHMLFQGVISYANEIVKTSWPEYVTGAVDVKICLYEALLNAYEHGNLEISSQEKEAILEKDPGSYEDFLFERAKQAPYCERKIDVRATIDTAKAVFRITDEGPGFNVKSLPDPTDPDNIMRNLGRGILLITSMMSDVSFNESGNALTMTMNRRRS